MSLVILQFVIFVLLLTASIPRWPYSLDWGYGPCGGLAVIGLLLVFDLW